MTPPGSLDTVLSAVKDFFRQEVVGGDEADLAPTTDLIEQGIIDSINLHRLIGFLEERFELRLPDELIVPQNFRTLKAIQELVGRLQQTGASSEKAN